MSRIVDNILTGVGKTLSRAHTVMTRILPWLMPWRWWPRRRRRWDQMALTDGHGKYRNMPCPCRSGLKLKRCHGATRQQKARWARQRTRHDKWMLERQQLRNISSVQA